ncbi:MAG: type IV toxin-antitoxin system AbiEi family antitoxin domain-containing protein, partial [Nocardioidaceae bacterium]
SCGYHDSDIDNLLDTGGWRRIRPGTYAPAKLLFPVNDEMVHLRRLFRLLRHGEPGLIASHQSAVALHALPSWGLDLSTLHVTSTGGRPGRHAGGLHRHVRRPLRSIQSWNGLRLVSPARAVAEVAANAPVAPALVVAEAALYAGLATPASLERAAGQLAGPEAGEARGVLARASPLSSSVAETRLRLLLADAGLPAPSSEPPPAIDGFVPGADLETSALWFPEHRTVVEFEPWQRYWRAEEDEHAVEVQPSEPPPLEYCWIDWPELDDPGLVVDRIRSAFARAASRSGVRIFDPDRPRTGRRRARIRAARLVEDGDLPC